MTKEDNKDFKNSARYWIRDNDYIDNDVKVIDHCHITEKCRGCVHRDYDINLKLNHKIPIVFHNLKNYDSRLIMQELGKFNFKINVIPNVLEKEELPSKEKFYGFFTDTKLSVREYYHFLKV